MWATGYVGHRRAYNVPRGNRHMAQIEDATATMRSLKWSTAEKAVARRAFESALRQEFEAVIREAKLRAAKVEQADELWELERYLTQRRAEIDRLYDFRYSVLPVVFGRLIHDGRLGEEDLHGLGEDKLALIRSCRKLSRA